MKQVQAQALADGSMAHLWAQRSGLLLGLGLQGTLLRTLSLTNAKLIRDAMGRSANSLTSLSNEADAAAMDSNPSMTGP